MNTSALLKCLLIIFHLELTRISADTNWDVFKLKKRFPWLPFPKPWYPRPIWVLKAEADTNVDTTGFDFTEQEITKLKLWPGGVIPYYIDKLSYDKVFRDKIRLYLEKVNNLASLEFSELRSPSPDDSTRFVMFINRREELTTQDYNPKNFTTTGAQRVVLGYDCFANGDIYPAILALVGVPPQHNAPNRDKYIEVKTENILPEKNYAFQILKDDEWLFHDMDYDFESAGHYDSHKHTKNGKATIVPKANDVSLISQDKKDFSVADIRKIQYLYNFMSSTKHIALRQSDCKKMYKPGPDFRNYEPKREKLRGTARDKPNKYLGLPDDHNSKGEDDTQPGQNDENHDGGAQPGQNDENVNHGTQLEHNDENAENSNIDKIQPDNDPQDDAEEVEI